MKKIIWNQKTDGGIIKMKILKTFENYNYVHDNSMVWVTGIPSGEALQVPYDSLNALYSEKLIWYDNKYTGVGFYAFNDDDIDLVKRFTKPFQKNLNIKKPKIKTSPDVMIYENYFDEELVDIIVGMINEYPEDIEIYIQEECMGITYGDYYIEIDIEEGRSPLYMLLKRLDGEEIDKYGISTDKQLIDRIETELYLTIEK